MSHVLNECKKLRDNYSVRHNVMVNKISEELKSTSDDIYVDKTITTSFKEHFETNIVAKSGHLVNIIDIACRYDLYVESLHTKKIEKYKCLKQLLSEKGYYCVIDPVIIGSLGAVHNKALSILLTMNMSKRKSKGFLKWCATSNIMHPKKIWNIRCRLKFD